MGRHLIAAALLSCGGVWASPVPTAADAAVALSLPAEVADSMRGIDPQRIRAHVKFLADDLLEGRGPGSRGGDLAAKYIATQFALLGLKPAGDEGSYLQKVDFKGVLTQAGTTAAMQPAQGAAVKFALGEDFVTSNQTQTQSADIDAQIVFVGYGINAPEYGWDDYQGVEVKGKVVLVIVNEPPSKDAKFFNGEALTYYGRWTYKFEQAARMGALGALIIHRTDLASYGWDVVRNSWSNEQVYLAGDKDPKLKSAAWIHLEAARKIFAASNLNMDDMLQQAGQRGFRARELPVRFSAHVASTVRDFASYNVLALQPGSAPGGRQAVVYSAHYDHLGIDANLKGDQIYNGAVDNATGCALLLEMAHAYATSRAHAPNAVLFAAVTAEEKGLLGSEYLGKHLPIPPGQVALDLNYDAIEPLGMPESVALTGADRTSFYPTVQKTAAAFGYEIQPDPEPGAGHYYRSDHFSLAREGVPAFSIAAGIKFVGHTAQWGKQQGEDYNDKRYHRPGDEYRESMDFSTDAELAKFGLALGWQALSAPSTVQWRAGDEFEARRLRGAQR